MQVVHLTSTNVDIVLSDWSHWVNYVTFCYNVRTHSSTGFAPNFIMTGQEPKWNIDYLLHNVDMSLASVPEYTAGVLQKLERAHALVREHLNHTAELTRIWYNCKVKEQTFCKGDRVRVYCPRRYKGKLPKWHSFYKNEAIVDRKLNNVTYVVRGSAWRKPKIVHVNKLKPIREFV